MIALPPVVTIACGAVTWFLGRVLVRKIDILSKYNLPAPVIGGLVISILLSLLHSIGIDLVKFDTDLVPTLMIAFFTSLGFAASYSDLKQGGRAVLVFLGACACLLVVQIVIGIQVSRLFDLPPLFGVMTSIVALAGGPGTALSFAPAFEEAGLKNAAAAGLSAAMLGIILGGILGGPIGTILIGQHKLSPERAAGNEGAEAAKSRMFAGKELPASLLYHSAIILIVGSIGWYLSKGLTAIGIKLPFYIGSMLVAAIVRNLHDLKLQGDDITLDLDWIDSIGSTCLTLFIAVSMMTLDLQSLLGVAAPLLTNLAIQALVLSIVALTVIYWISGRDYDAAVMSGGMMGFMLGTTANALATMSAIVQKYGPAPRAFFVVPLVGACFIDFINAIIISVALNIYSH